MDKDGPAIRRDALHSSKFAVIFSLFFGKRQELIRQVGQLQLKHFISGQWGGMWVLLL